MVKLSYRIVGLILAFLVGMMPLGAVAMAEETSHGVVPANQMSPYRAIGLGLAAAFAIGVSVLGAGYAVGRIGSAALGLAAEKPELLTRSILFVALAEGLAVLGFAIAMMLMQKI
jgi:V/A-type H+/Na+-transporting ATPase subunit K